MKTALLVCSPNAGMLDNWLPILFNLKKKIKIEIFIPKESLIFQIKSNKFFFKNIDRIFSTIHYQKDFAGINSVKSFDNVKRNNLRYFSILVNKFFLKLFNREIDIYVFFLWFFSFFKKSLIEYNNIFKHCDIILCDILELQKSYLYYFNKYALNKCKISMCHGPDFPYFNKNYVKINKNYHPPGSSITNKIILFSKTKHEISYYKNRLSNLQNDFYRIGNPKHDPKWVNYILKKEFFFNNKKQPYVFIISRNAEKSYLPSYKKLQYIQWIKEKILDELKLKIVVKLHPKENIETYYYKIFGKKNYGKSWVYSDDHPFAIGKKALFSISFFSGVAVDMNKIKTPNIEILDLKDFAKKNSSSIFFNRKKEPVFRIRYLNLTMGASSQNQFNILVDSILCERKIIIKNLSKNYVKYYNSELNSIKKISKLIMDAL